MGNKDAGRVFSNMDFISYNSYMGGTIQNIQNTGVSFTNAEVHKYFKMLRNYALSRYKWHCSQMTQEECKLIEWHIFHLGYCAMLKPIVTVSNVSLKLDKLKIYRCAFNNINIRNGRPRQITLVGHNNSRLPIKDTYCEDEFVILTDEYLYPQFNTPFAHVAWEFANKLHELDLAFNANSHRMRMPFVFNNGSSQVQKEGHQSLINVNQFDIAETMRSAMGRNEQFVDIPEDAVGLNGFLHEPAHVENHMLEHLEAQKRLYEAYFELLGLYTNREKQGSYTVKELQQEGDETGDFKTDIGKRNRDSCCREAVEKFGVTMLVEVV